jgi:anti-anti-sigma factor
MTPLGSQLAGPDSTVLIVHMPGRVTDEHVGPIREEVRSRLPRVDGAGLVLDFAGTELINSIGITCLLSIEEDCRSRGVRVVIAALPAGVSNFLRQLKLTGRFQIVSSVDDALAWLGV